MPQGLGCSCGSDPLGTGCRTDMTGEKWVFQVLRAYGGEHNWNFVFRKNRVYVAAAQILSIIQWQLWSLDWWVMAVAQMLKLDETIARTQE